MIRRTLQCGLSTTMNRILPSTLLIICLLSCSNPSDIGPDLLPIDVSKAFENKQELLLSQFVSEVKYIKLETRPECLFASVGNLHLGQKYLLASNGFQGNVYLFTPQGKFIKTIGSRGKGPGEYVSIAGLAIDRNEEFLYLCDPRQKRLIRYGLEDDSAVSVQLDGVLAIHGIALAADDLFVYVMPDFSRSDRYSILQFSSELKLKKSYLTPTEPIDRIANSFAIIKYYQQEFWLSNSVLNSLDVYDRNFELTRRYQLENRPANEEVFSLAFFSNGLFIKLVSNMMEKNPPAGEVTRISNINNLFRGSIYLENGQDPVFPLNPSIMDDISGLGRFTRPGDCTEQGYLIHHLDVQFLKENSQKYENMDPVLRKLVEEAGDGDNPVVRVLKLKD